MRTFVTEPVVLAIFGELLSPPEPVRFLFPLSAVRELQILVGEKLSSDKEEQAAIQANIERLLAFWENPFVRKRIEPVTVAPWRMSHPILYNDKVTFQVVNAVDTAAYGEEFDPIETELILLAIKEDVPLLIEDPSVHERIIQLGIPVQVFDVADFEFALEEELPGLPSANAENRPQRHILPAVIFGGFLLILAAALIVSLR